MNDNDLDALEEMNQQQDDSEAHLYYSILDAIQQAKALGLAEEHLKVLCYIGGIDFDNLI